MSSEPDPCEAPSMLVRRASIAIFLLSLCAMTWSASFSSFLMAMKPDIIVPSALQATLLISWLLVMLDFQAIVHLMKKTYGGWPYDEGKERALRMLFRITIFAGAVPLFIMVCHDISFIF